MAFSTHIPLCQLNVSSVQRGSLSGNLPWQLLTLATLEYVFCESGQIYVISYFQAVIEAIHCGRTMCCHCCEVSTGLRIQEEIFFFPKWTLVDGSRKSTTIKDRKHLPPRKKAPHGVGNCCMSSISQVSGLKEPQVILRDRSNW